MIVVVEEEALLHSCVQQRAHLDAQNTACGQEHLQSQGLRLVQEEGEERPTRAQAGDKLTQNLGVELQAQVEEAQDAHGQLVLRQGNGVVEHYVPANVFLLDKRESINWGHTILLCGVNFVSNKDRLLRRLTEVNIEVPAQSREPLGNVQGPQHLEKLITEKNTIEKAYYYRN